MPADFFTSFIAGELRATALLPARPLDEEAWASAHERAGQRCLGAGLLAELKRQAAKLPASPARDRNLELLARPGTTVVVTGQQTGLFLGPLYTLHKAATAVARARWLSQYTGRPCVPVFWLQTEDHDWAEVAHAEVLLAGGRKTLELPAETAEQARVSMAQRVLPPEVDALTALLGDLLNAAPHGAAVASLLARHYQMGRTPGDAFAGVVAELFAEEGLVILDPRTPGMARLALPVLRRAIEQQEAIAAALATRAEALAKSDFPEQVHTRPDASLAFFHPQGPHGPRYRLQCTAAGFCTPQGEVSRTELLSRLEAEPLCFSTSALLRPLVQDSLLPTAAYVGGPAECAYFAQLPPLYSLFEVELPMVAPRARFRLLDAGTRRLLERLGLGPEDTERSRDDVAALVQSRPAWLPPAEWLRARLLGPLERELDALLPHAVTLEPGLAKSIQKTRDHVAYGVEKLVTRVERAARARDHVTADNLERLWTALRPDGNPQERVYAFPPLAAQVGTRALVATLVEAAHPLSADVRSVDL